MRRLAWLAAMALACLVSGCPKPAAKTTGGATVKAHVLQGLPSDWPLPDLTLPAGAKGFEGHVGPSSDGNSTDYTAFFSSSDPWETILADVEAELRPLGYVVMASDAPAGPNAPKDAGLAAPDGRLLVFLSYDESKESQSMLGTAGYYTLLVKKMNAPVDVDPTWKKL